MFIQVFHMLFWINTHPWNHHYHRGHRIHTSQCFLHPFIIIVVVLSVRTLNIRSTLLANFKYTMHCCYRKGVLWSGCKSSKATQARLVERKACFLLYFRCRQLVEGGCQTSVQRPIPPPPLADRLGWELLQKDWETAQSTLTVGQTLLVWSASSWSF